MWIEETLNEKFIMGVDEVGRGPLLGDCVSCACIFPKNQYIIGVNDSKKLTEKKRLFYYDLLFKNAIAIGCGLASPKEIDEINILEATKLSMKRAIDAASLFQKPDVVLVDAVKLNSGYSEISIVKGDSLSYSIASASILAKVCRDRLCYGWDRKYPEYEILKHKGYGTKKHIDAILKYGKTDLHRNSFIKKYI